MLTARGAGLIDSDKVVAVKFEAEHQPTSSPQNKLSNATKYKFLPGQCARRGRGSTNLRRLLLGAGKTLLEADY